MCGIVGVAAAFTMSVKDKDFFKDALFCDQLRGKDSTGIIAVPKDAADEVETFKKAYPAGDFMQLARARAMYDFNSDPRVLIGHNRAATKGLVVHENAHPFTHGNITMVHNGTLKQYAKLPGYTNYAVDSALLCRGISELGIQETVDRITGAYALVWWDAGDRTLNFLRNKERPLSIGNTVTGNNLYFASEMGMLEWISERQGIDLADVVSLTPDQHLKINVNGLAFSPVVTEVKKVATVIVRPVYTPPAQHGNKGGTVTSITAKEKLTRDAPPEVRPSPDENLQAHIYKFLPYKGDINLGVMKGITVTKAYMAVELHNTRIEDFIVGKYGFKVLSCVWAEKSGEWKVRGIGAGIVSEVTVTEKKPGGPDADAIRVEEDRRKKALEGIEERVSGLLQGVRLPKEGGFVPLHNDDLEADAFDSYGTTMDMYGDYTIPWEDDHSFDIAGPFGSQVTEKEFNQLTNCGCAVCCCDIDIVDAEDITWKDFQTPICAACEAEELFEREDSKSATIN